jgi:protein-tyrosine phosphatase
MVDKKSPKRTRVKSFRLADEMRKHSPLKKGLIVKDEDEPLEDFNKILPRLYLGNKYAAKSKSFMDAHKIKAVLNCSKEKDIPNYFKDSSIEYMRVPVDDSLQQKDYDKMFLLLPSMVEFIHKHVDILKQPILVHCWAGRQRSACAVVCYLMEKHGLNPDEACKLVMSKRKEAFHFGKSVNFDQTINKYYKKIQKKKA